MSMLDKVNEIDKDSAIEELLLDGGYQSIRVLEESIKRNINVLCATGKNGKKKQNNRRW